MLVETGEGGAAADPETSKDIRELDGGAAAAPETGEADSLGQPGEFGAGEFGG